jgi:hypothetical protein
VGNITNCMEPSPPFEPVIGGVRKETLCLVWNLEVQCPDHNIQPLIPILNHLNPVNIFAYKIDLNLTLQSTLRFENWSLIFRRRDKYFLSTSYHACGRPRSCHLLIRSPNEYILWSSSLCNPSQPPLIYFPKVQVRLWA